MPYLAEHPSLPYRGTTKTTRACSEAGARSAQPRAGSQTLRIYQALQVTPSTLQELAVSCRMPLASVCSRIGSLRHQRLIEVQGAKINPVTGVPNAVWRCV
jgi:hypothetical protein